jgi:hypothetical protein
MVTSSRGWFFRFLFAVDRVVSRARFVRKSQSRPQTCTGIESGYLVKPCIAHHLFSPIFLVEELKMAFCGRLSKKSELHRA